MFFDPGQARRPPAHQGLRGTAHDIGKGLVGQHDPILAVDHQQAFRQGVQRRAHAAGHNLGGVEVPERTTDEEVEQAGQHRGDRVDEHNAGVEAPPQPARGPQGPEAEFDRPPLLLTARVQRHLDVGIGGRCPFLDSPLRGVVAHLGHQRAVRPPHAHRQDLRIVLGDRLQEDLQAGQIAARDLGGPGHGHRFAQPRTPHPCGLIRLRQKSRKPRPQLRQHDHRHQDGRLDGQQAEGDPGFGGELEHAEVRGQRSEVRVRCQGVGGQGATRLGGDPF